MRFVVSPNAPRVKRCTQLVIHLTRLRDEFYRANFKESYVKRGFVVIDVNASTATYREYE